MKVTDIKNRLQELGERAILAWSILRSSDGNLEQHIKRETGHMRDGVDGPDEWMAHALLDIGRVFSVQGHSGSSADWCIATLTPLLSFKPLRPLTGEDSEWVLHNFGGECYAQNSRCSHVFKRHDGSAYDSEAVIFREPDGACFHSFHSRRDITFPYSPRRVYADVPLEATDEQKQEAAEYAWSAT